MDKDDPTVKLIDLNNAANNPALTEINNRLQALEEGFEKRGYDTRPIFEALEKKVSELEGRLQEIHAEIKELKNQLKEIPNEPRTNRKRSCYFKLKYDDSIHKVPATDVEDDFIKFTIYDGNRIVGQYPRERVTEWSLEEA